MVPVEMMIMLMVMVMAVCVTVVGMRMGVIVSAWYWGASVKRDGCHEDCTNTGKCAVEMASRLQKTKSEDEDTAQPEPYLFLTPQ